MPIFHIVNSSLGGMGKSLFSQSLIHIHQKLDIAYVAFDADVETQNVYQMYPETTQLLEISDSQFRNTDIVYRVMETGQAIIVNLAASSTRAVEQWFKRDDLFRVVAELGRDYPSLSYQMVNWFLSDGSPSSLARYLDAVEGYGDLMVHVLVQNLGRSRFQDWERILKDPQIRTALALPYTRRMIFPKFIKPFGFDALGWTFERGLSATESERLAVLDRQRIATFLKQTRQSIESTELIDAPASRGVGFILGEADSQWL